jgi:hypothetical protein
MLVDRRPLSSITPELLDTGLLTTVIINNVKYFEPVTHLAAKVLTTKMLKVIPSLPQELLAV